MRTRGLFCKIHQISQCWKYIHLKPHYSVQKTHETFFHWNPNFMQIALRVKYSCLVFFFWFNQRHSFLCNEVLSQIHNKNCCHFSLSLSGVCLTPKQSFLVVSWQLKYLPNWLWNFHAFNQRPAEKGRLYKVLGRLLAVPTKRRMDQKNRCSACFHLLSS